MPDHGMLEDLIGAVDNFDEPTPTWNRDSTIIGMTIAFGGITSTCVLLRLYARFQVLKLPGWDDYLMVLIMLMGGIGTITVCLSPGLGGLGRHYLHLSDEQQTMHFKLFYVADGSFVTTVSLIKLSILLQYLRIYDSGFQRHLCLAMFAVVAIWAAVTSFMAWFPCFPPAGYWNWNMENRKCFGYGSLTVAGHYATFLAHSIVNMVLDLIILVLPLPLLFRSGTLHRTKLGLGGLLTLGVIANILAALRLAETIRHRAMTYPTFDQPWYAPALCMLGMLEVNFACIGASVPVFWPVFRDRLGSIFVTREINVSVTDRGSGDVHLHRSESLYSQDQSDGTQRLWRERSAGPSAGDHYKDTYVMDQVDPLRKKTTMVVDSVVTTGNGHTAKSSSQEFRDTSI